MRIHEAGRESKLLKQIKDGIKVIECRLNRSKFALYKPEDRVWLREDIYSEGKIVKSKPRQVLVEVDKIEKYATFNKCLKR